MISEIQMQECRKVNVTNKPIKSELKEINDIKN